MKYLPQLLTVFVTVIVLAWIYILFVREWLVRRWPERFLWWHLIEDKLWANSRTILIARLYWVGAIILAIHDTLATQGFDWTPITQQITKYIPPEYAPIAIAAFLALTGIAFDWLRHQTTEPIRKE